MGMSGLRRIVAVACIVAASLSLTSCKNTPSKVGGPSPSPSPTLDRARVDQLIDLGIRGQQRLVHLQGKSTQDLLAEYRLVIGDFSSMVRQLRDDRPSGLSESVARNVAEDTDSFVVALQAAVDCLDKSSPYESNPCQAVISASTERASKAGEALSKLIPFGTRTSQEVLDLVQK